MLLDLIYWADGEYIGVAVSEVNDFFTEVADEPVMVDARFIDTLAALQSIYGNGILEIETASIARAGAESTFSMKIVLPDVPNPSDSRRAAQLMCSTLIEEALVGPDRVGCRVTTTSGYDYLLIRAPNLQP
jgi:hypothetical protein